MQRYGTAWRYNTVKSTCDEERIIEHISEMPHDQHFTVQTSYLTNNTVMSRREEGKESKTKQRTPFVQWRALVNKNNVLETLVKLN